MGMQGETNRHSSAPTQPGREELEKEHRLLNEVFAPVAHICSSLLGATRLGSSPRVLPVARSTRLPAS